MAERRMFAKTIIDSDAFLDMPVTARLLYYDLAMRADDDGFVNAPKKIMRVIGASQDDLAILILRKFLLPFENGVVVIKHWRIHNYIRQDRYKETPYSEQKELLEFDENNAYRFKSGETVNQVATIGQPNDNQRLPQDRIGKVSINNNTNMANFDAEFDEVWREYPRKERRADALKAYLAARKSGTDKDTILAGIARYKAYIAAERIEPRYIAQGGTWFNQKRWMDEYATSKNYTEREIDESKYEGVYE